MTLPMMLCKTPAGDLEEVNEFVFKLRDQVMIDEEKRRYTDEHFFINNGVIEIHGKIDRNTFALLGRSLGIQSPTPAQIRECPTFVFIKQKKGTKNKVMDTKSGTIYK